MHIRNEETAAERLRTRLIILYKQPTVIEAALGVFQAVGCPRWDVRVCGTTLVSSRIIIFHGKWECLLYPVLYQVLHSAFYYLLIFLEIKVRKSCSFFFPFRFMRFPDLKCLQEIHVMMTSSRPQTSWQFQSGDQFV